MDTQQQLTAPETTYDSLHTLLEGQTIWSVARLYGYTAEELAEHNDISKEDMFTIQEGYVLHLPIARQIPKSPEVTYEPFGEPRIMHANKTDTRKWSFAHVRGWTDIQPIGRVYKKGSVVTIVALAKVPVDGQIAAYYMDDTSYNSIPRRTTGFKWRDLKAGNPSVYPPSEVPVQDPPKPEPENPNQYKTTYVAFEEGSVRHKFTRRVTVPEMDGRRMPKERNLNDEVDIAGIFKKDDMFYGRPYGCIASGLWFGVPMDSIIEKSFDTEIDEIYTTTETLATNRLTFKHGRLNIEERMIAVPLSKLHRRRKNIMEVLAKIKERK